MPTVWALMNRLRYFIELALFATRGIPAKDGLLVITCSHLHTMAPAWGAVYNEGSTQLGEGLRSLAFAFVPGRTRIKGLTRCNSRNFGKVIFSWICRRIHGNSGSKTSFQS